MAAWGLQGLRGSLRTRGAKAFLPAPLAPSATGKQPPVAQQELAVLPTTQQEPAAAPALVAQETRITKEGELVQLRARLTVAEAASMALEATSGKGPVSSAWVVATTTVAPIATQRAVAVEVMQEIENKFMELVQS